LTTELHLVDINANGISQSCASARVRLGDTYSDVLSARSPLACVAAASRGIIALAQRYHSLE